MKVDVLIYLQVWKDNRIELETELLKSGIGIIEKYKKKNIPIISYVISNNGLNIYQIGDTELKLPSIEDKEKFGLIIDGHGTYSKEKKEWILQGIEIGKLVSIIECIGKKYNCHKKIVKISCIQCNGAGKNPSEIDLKKTFIFNLGNKLKIQPMISGYAGAVYTISTNKDSKHFKSIYLKKDLNDLLLKLHTEEEARNDFIIRISKKLDSTENLPPVLYQNNDKTIYKLKENSENNIIPSGKILQKKNEKKFNLYFEAMDKKVVSLKAGDLVISLNKTRYRGSKIRSYFKKRICFGTLGYKPKCYTSIDVACEVNVYANTNKRVEKWKPIFK